MHRVCSTLGECAPLPPNHLRCLWRYSPTCRTCGDLGPCWPVYGQCWCSGGAGPFGVREEFRDAQQFAVINTHPACRNFSATLRRAILSTSSLWPGETGIANRLVAKTRSTKIVTNSGGLASRLVSGLWRGCGARLVSDPTSHLASSLWPGERPGWRTACLQLSKQSPSSRSGLKLRPGCNY